MNIQFGEHLIRLAQADLNYTYTLTHFELEILKRLTTPCGHRFHYQSCCGSPRGCDLVVSKMTSWPVALAAI